MVLLLFFYLYISGECSVKEIFWEMADFFYDENIDLMETRVNFTNTFRECIMLSSLPERLVIQNFHSTLDLNKNQIFHKKSYEGDIRYAMYLSIIIII